VVWLAFEESAVCENNCFKIGFVVVLPSIFFHFFLAHLAKAKGKVSFDHHLASVVR
jgi:hypothetical protein